MKRKILSVMLSAVLTITMLVGCGNSVETGGRVEATGTEDEGIDSEADKQTPVDDKEGERLFFEAIDSNGVLFPGTIFDDIVLGETTEEELLQVLDERDLGYDLDHEDTTVISYVSAGTLYDWDVNYEYRIYKVDEKTHILAGSNIYFDIKDNTKHKELIDFLQKIIGFHPIKKVNLRGSELDTLVISCYDNTVYNDNVFMQNPSLMNDVIVLNMELMPSYVYNRQILDAFCQAATDSYVMNNELFPKTGTVTVNCGNVHVTGTATTSTGVEDKWINSMTELLAYWDIDKVNEGLLVDYVVFTNIEITLDLDAETVTIQAYDSEGLWGDPVIGHI